MVSCVTARTLRISNPLCSSTYLSRSIKKVVWCKACSADGGPKAAEAASRRLPALGRIASPVSSGRSTKILNKPCACLRNPNGSREPVDALEGFLGSDDGANLLTAHKRASNIVAIEEKKDAASYDGEADVALLSEDQERTLHSRLGELRTRIAPVLADEKFDDAMAVLAELRRPVDDFFDHVTVNAEDGKQRVNRLRLLSEIRATMGEIADFGQIEG